MDSIGARRPIIRPGAISLPVRFGRSNFRCHTTAFPAHCVKASKVQRISSPKGNAISGEIEIPVLSEQEAELLDAWWRASNYLGAAQIFLKENALLRKLLKAEHLRPRLLGHRGTTPG